MKGLLTMLFFFIFIHCSTCNDDNKDPFTMQINGRTSEAMRLFKMNAQGLLPQLVQRIEEIDIEQGKELKVHNNLKYKKFNHNQESIIPSF